jgi:DNA-directed RNA polymerase specialized sigma24 family protein
MSEVQSHRSPGHSMSSRRAQRFLGFELSESDEALLIRLPRPQREILQSQGDYKTRAQELGIPIGTVRSRLHRARAALEKLRHQRDDPATSPNASPMQ